MTGNIANRVLRLLALPITLLAGAVGAEAAEIDSAYTKLDLNACPIIEQNLEEGSWTLVRCKGYRGRPVFVGEGDLRFFVWFDDKESEEPLRSQTLGPFNTIGETLEWRVRRVGGDWQPFATILRYRTSLDEDQDQGEVLVVSQIQPGATCHIAYVDVRSNPDANALARDAADRLAGSFDCADTPERIGVPGPSLGE
ncbi:hypothetical protein [Rhodobium gokarnense]|uniref:Uncharacterized protein n=1 Tax=Rhodobium gokarnense TaxID=364296 RepID=A0ABT3HI15_9HYPH|nr:hypothetical protein [Rhodobium gokarnense]MCW2309901.1 hypothetical protein [Rhodobium gokarnense]